MSAPEAFDFAAEFEVPPYLPVIQQAVAIDDRQRRPCPFNYLFGLKLQIRSVRDRKNDHLHALQGCGKVVLDTYIDQFLLIAEKSRQRVAG